MKFSVIIVAYNEEKRLENCLKQFIDYTDDFVVLDTESQDGTNRIAKKFTDKVYLVPYIATPDPYYEPAMLRANYDWCLLSCPDEYWDQDCLRNLSKFDKEDIDAVKFHRFDNGKDDGYHVRLLRKGKVMITDLLDWWENSGARMVSSDYVIKHERTEEDIRRSKQFRKDSSVYIKQKYRFTNLEPYKSRIVCMPY